MASNSPKVLVARMLYDHDADPDENRNISELSENAELVKSLSAALNAGWQADSVWA